LMYKVKMTQMSHFDSLYTAKKMWVMLRAKLSPSPPTTVQSLPPRSEPIISSHLHISKLKI
jgi:hypothetical protein